MCATTMMLVSKDAALVDNVSHVVGSIVGLGLRVAADIEEVCSRLEQEGAALVMAHVPEGGGLGAVLHLLQTVKTARRAVATLVVTDRHHPEEALHLLRRGVADYLSRPLDNQWLTCLIEILTARFRQVARRPTAATDSLEHLGTKDPFLFLPDEDMGHLMEQIRRVAPQDTTVLLGGETGTGKTRMARLIHELSPRRESRLLVANCGALAPSLIESELFGHVKGAFTGADRDRAGKLAEAGRGTLVLDEIDALPPVLQAKLLRVVEERVFEPVGSEKTLPMQARLIAASNKPLDQEVAAGRFRSDLFYRLNVVCFNLPPLRDRPGVLQGMIERFIAEFAERTGQIVSGIAADALRALREYQWPGNVRELRNVIERAVALGPGEVIQLSDLPAPLCPNGVRSADANGNQPAVETRATLVRAKEEAEAALITRILRKHQNNRERAAAELGISRMTLYNKLRRYGIVNSN